MKKSRSLIRLKDHRAMLAQARARTAVPPLVYPSLASIDACHSVHIPLSFFRRRAGYAVVDVEIHRPPRLPDAPDGVLRPVEVRGGQGASLSSKRSTSGI